MFKIVICLLLPIIFISSFAFGQKEQLSDVARVMFNGNFTELTNSEKNSIAAKLMLKLDDNNKLVFSNGEGKLVDILITPTDFNNDGIQEYFIAFKEELNEFDKGRGGLFTRRKLHDTCNVIFFRTNHGEVHVYKNKSFMPDIVFPNSGGEDISGIYKWNDSEEKYEQIGFGLFSNNHKPSYSIDECSIVKGLKTLGTEQVNSSNANANTSTNSDIKIAFSSSNPEINQLSDCQRLVNTGKTQAEKDELQKDYWTLLGIISDLSNYRESFLKEGKFINLFPTAYYHTTYLEMQSMLSLNFAYPIETMKQMIAFYDAYKWNRDNWDKGNESLVEEHWKKHFEDAESFWSSANILCMKTGDVLSSAITAHVEYDLQRAIRYAANERFNKNISFLQYKVKMNPDFLLTDDMFGTSMTFTIQDISSASLCKQFITQLFSMDKYGKFIGITVPNKLGVTHTFTDADVINMRHKAWDKAFLTNPFFEPSETLMKAQPVTDHNPLIAIGKNLCPPTPTPDKQTFKILPEWVTHPTDKEFKWYGWDEAPEDLKIATGYLNEYTNIQTKKIVTVLDDINNVIKEGCSVRIAAMDLDNNGIAGIAIYTEGAYCCGDQQRACGFDLSENAGARYGSYLERTGNPSPQEYAGYIMQSGKEIILHQVNKEIISLFKYDTTGLNLKPPIAKVNDKNSVGGATPDELGRNLLKALQTNNKDLWVNCISPTTEKEYRDAVTRDFDVVHSYFEERGISNWNLTKFDRATYQKCAGCQPKDGSALLTNFVVEFLYKGEEFIGAFSITRVITYKGRYYTDGCRDCDAVMRRK